MHPLKRAFSLRCVQFATGVLVLAALCGCARSRAQPRQLTEGCGALAQSMANEESAFVARAQAIRERHILLRDYDRQMIALLDERRKSIESRLLTAASADEGVSGCSGQQLESLRTNALQEMVLLQNYVNTFRRGLEEDPAGVFIDSW
jgi:hypothetical protein